MNKQMMIFATLFVSLLTSQAMAYGNLNSKLQQAVIDKFVQEANVPTSKLGLLIAKINQETTDGRNDNGTINLPVTADDLQIVVLSEETMYNPWHYASKENGMCVAGGDSANYLILLSQHTGVHAASEFDTIMFKASAEELFSAEIRKVGEDVNCQELTVGDDNEEFGKILYKAKPSEIVQVPVGN
jgi:hypothetical protein